MADGGWQRWQGERAWRDNATRRVKLRSDLDYHDPSHATVLWLSGTWWSGKTRCTEVGSIVTDMTPDVATSDESAVQAASAAEEQKVTVFIFSRDIIYMRGFVIK
jgi:hypothetical protein